MVQLGSAESAQQNFLKYLQKSLYTQGSVTRPGDWVLELRSQPENIARP